VGSFLVKFLLRRFQLSPSLEYPLTIKGRHDSSMVNGMRWASGPSHPDSFGYTLLLVWEGRMGKRKSGSNYIISNNEKHIWNDFVDYYFSYL
jgi:hypothetical protein